MVQGYIEQYANNSALPVKGCLLSGTRGPGGLKITLGALFLSIIARVKGPRRYSLISEALSSGSYNKPFKPNRTRFDWLSRDEKEVDAYIEDPLCGFRCSSGFYRDMIRGLAAIHKRQAIARIQRNLPIYIYCGSADPVGEMGASPTALVSAYQQQGISDLEFVLYPEARHEVHNETNREEAMEYILNWLLRHLE